MKRIIIVEYKNICLVAPEKEDIDIIFPEFNNRETCKFLDQDDFSWWVLPKLREEKFLTEQMSKHWHFMCIYKKDTEEIVWTISLHTVSERHRYATPWITIFSSFRNQWIWQQAMRLILKYAFEFQWFHKINLYVWGTNIWWIKCYEKCWFTTIWTHKEHFWDYNNYVDVVDMEILVNEYEKLSKDWFTNI